MSKILYFSYTFLLIILLIVINTFATEINTKNDNCFTTPSFCYLQPETGSCRGFFTNYYYDVNTKSCEEFTYGGCGGNQNNFMNKTSCIKTCIVPLQRLVRSVSLAHASLLFCVPALVWGAAAPISL